MAIDASKIGFFEIMLIASRHKEDDVFLAESNDVDSIYACKEDLSTYHKFEKINGRISTKDLFNFYSNYFRYDTFNQYTDLEDEDGMTIAIIKFKGMAQKFKVQLDDDFKTMNLQNDKYQAKDIERYFGEWELA